MSDNEHKNLLDEWQENIDNNAYTNGTAITSLRCAAKAAEEAAKHPAVETNNEIGSNASPTKTAPEAETKTEEIKTEDTVAYYSKTQ